MNVMFHDGIVENAVAHLQVILLLAILDFDLTLHDVDEFLALMRGQFEVLLLIRLDVDDERLHVPSRLLLSEGVILHVLPCVGRSVGEANAAVALLSAANNRS